MNGMRDAIDYFRQLLGMAVSNYLKLNDDGPVDLRAIPVPGDGWLKGLLPADRVVSFEERVVLLLALMPSVSPQVLDLLLMRNEDLDRPFTVFGGWRGTSHCGFLPTGETAAFILAPNDLQARVEVIRLFGREHWFRTEGILHLDGQGDGEPLLSGRLQVSDEILVRMAGGDVSRPEYSASFPARLLTTPLEWDDLVLPYDLHEELEDILFWQRHQCEIRNRWGLDRYLKRGYRCLFYGPPGTGKTMAATLIGKQCGLDVYRIDLSMMVSKYIGETEKNLSGVFDRAEHGNWILFFDEADALFGRRTETGSSNDRYANQEVSYLLQRIEDFPGMVLLATNLRTNIDEAFFRRFQSSLCFPMPDRQLRVKLWQSMFPQEWELGDRDAFFREAARHELSGGSMLNVIRTCAVRLYHLPEPIMTPHIFHEAITKELAKEGRLVNL